MCTLAPPTHLCPPALRPWMVAVILAEPSLLNLRDKEEVTILGQLPQKQGVSIKTFILLNCADFSGPGSQLLPPAHSYTSAVRPTFRPSAGRSGKKGNSGVWIQPGKGEAGLRSDPTPASIPLYLSGPGKPGLSKKKSYRLAF